MKKQKLGGVWDSQHVLQKHNKFFSLKLAVKIIDVIIIEINNYIEIKPFSISIFGLYV